MCGDVRKNVYVWLCVYVQCEQYEKDLRAEERRHLDVCSDLSRQYKALQRDYMNQLDDTQSAFQAHRREYAEQSILLRQLGASRDKELAEYDTRVRGKTDKEQHKETIQASSHTQQGIYYSSTDLHIYRYRHRYIYIYIDLCVRV